MGKPRNKGRKFGGTNTSIYNNLTALGGGGEAAEKTKRRSENGKYEIGFTKKLDNATEHEIELSERSGIELIHLYTHVARDMIQLKQKSELQTLTAVDRVFIVHRGKEVIGKLSIRIMRVGEKATILYVYRQKTYSHKNKKAKNKQLWRENI